MKLRKFACLLVLIAPVAHAELWLCTDAEGNKALNYEPESAGNKNCVRQILTPHQNIVRKRVPEASYGAANFPRVDARTQKMRDLERREILERELAEEQKSLEAANRQLAEEKQAAARNERNDVRAQAKLKPYEARVRQHEANIQSLKRELGNQKPRDAS